MVALGGHAWFYLGGMHGFIWGVACMVLFSGGGMHGFIQQGVCVVLFSGEGVRGFIQQGGHAWFYSAGGACMVFSVFSDTMRYGQ